MNSLRGCYFERIVSDTLQCRIVNDLPGLSAKKCTIVSMDLSKDDIEQAPIKSEELDTPIKTACSQNPTFRGLADLLGVQ